MCLCAKVTVQEPLHFVLQRTMTFHALLFFHKSVSSCL